MSDTKAEATGGIGFTGLLTILFIGLKLAHIINWSWWWVLSPIWISLAVFVGLMGIFLIILLIVLLTKGVGT